MKKFFALFLALSMFFALTACGESIEKTPAGESTGTTISATEASISTEGNAEGTMENTNGTTEGATEGTDSNTTNTTETPTVTPPTTESSTTPPTTTPPTTSITEAPHTHSYTSKITTVATCGKEGVKTFTCSCGSSYTETIAATGQHSWNAATCTTPKTCTKCNAISGTTSGHSWSNWETITPAEVGKAGQEKRLCSSCKQSETRDIPALQEDYTKKWFVAQYNLAKQQYLNSLEQSKVSKQDEITDLKAKIDNELDKYTDKRIDILNKYPPSATRDTMLTNAQQNYAAAIKPYKDKISRLESEIETIDAEVANPNVDSILVIVTKNCNISSSQTYEYYYKYSDSID